MCERDDMIADASIGLAKSLCDVIGTAADEQRLDDDDAYVFASTALAQCAAQLIAARVARDHVEGCPNIPADAAARVVEQVKLMTEIALALLGVDVATPAVELRQEAVH
jgi:hypothetical protein